MQKYRLNKYVYYNINTLYCVITNLYNGVTLYLSENDLLYFKNLVNLEEFFYDENHKCSFDLLHKNEVIVAIEFNESEYVLNRFYNFDKGNKLHLTLFVTELCNMSCNYCFVNKDEYSTMSYQTLDSIFIMIKNIVKTNNYKIIDISWFGGEPLLAIKNIKYFLTILNTWCSQNNITVLNRLFTNGYLLNLYTFLELYKLGINSLQVTFDGDEVEHNKTRQHKDCKDTFNKIYDNLLVIKKLSLSDFNINIRCNYIKHKSSKYIDTFISKYLNNFESDPRFKLNISPIVDFSEWGNHNKEYSTYIGNTKYLLEKAKTYKSLKENLLYLIKPNKGWCPIFNPHNLTFNTKGELYACQSVISNSKYKIGKITENGILSVDNNIINQEKHLDKKCEKCKKLPICFGTCYIIKNDYGKNACCCIDNEIEKTLEFLLNEEV